MTTNDEPTGDKAMPEEIDARTERDIKASELLGNAAKVKGDDFANYAASLIELAQLNLMIKVLATGTLDEDHRAAMAAQGTLLTSSIDTKIFGQLSLPDRIEAGKLAAQVIELTKKAGG
ncbi:hypothetical protein D3C87_1513830 [compost metagenome]